MHTRSKTTYIRMICAQALGLTAGVGTWAAGPAGVPELPERPKIATAGGEADEDFWGSYWHTPGGLTWKEVNFEPQLNYRAFYTGNIYTIANTQARSDFLHYVSPAISMGRSFEGEARTTALRVSYQPTFVVYNDQSQFDRVDHAARFNLDHSWGEQSIEVEHKYQRTSEATIQTAYLVQQEVQRTRLGYDRPLGTKIRLETEAVQDFRDSSNAGNIQEMHLKRWQGSAFASMQVFPKITGGLGLSGGYAEQRSAVGRYTAINERVLTRWRYQLSGKVTADLDAGVQFMQSLDSGFDDPSVRPVLEGTVNYQPRYGTTFGVTGYRSAEAAEFRYGQVFSGTGVKLSARQRVFENAAIIARLSYANGEFEVLAPGSATRSDFDLYTAELEVQWRINARLTASVFYQYIDYRADVTVESLSNNQVGFNLRLMF